MSKFREFTNDINAKQKTVSKMPTYDNFKQNFNSKTKSPMRDGGKNQEFGAAEVTTKAEMNKEYRLEVQKMGRKQDENYRELLGKIKN